MAAEFLRDPRYPEAYIYITYGNISYPSDTWSDRASLELSYWVGTIGSNINSNNTFELRFGETSLCLICKINQNNDINIYLYKPNEEPEYLTQINTKDLLKTIIDAIIPFKKEVHNANMIECEKYLNDLAINTYETIRTCTQKPQA